MNHADHKPVLASVKLFPRLAMTKSKQPKRPIRTIHGSHLKQERSTDSRESRRSHVRARLLRMILDNEEVRRNDRRPNAS